MTLPRAAAAAFVVVCLALGGALAAPSRALPQATQPTTDVRHGRPPAGSWRRGLLRLPAVSVVAIGALIVVAASAALARRARRPPR